MTLFNNDCQITHGPAERSFLNRIFLKVKVGKYRPMARTAA